VSAAHLGTFHVDLKDVPQDVWPLLPSTAQFTSPERPYGFLLLSLEWQQREQQRLTGLGIAVDFASLDEGGGKWPIGAADDYASVRRMLSGIKDNAVRKGLLETLDTLLTKVP
jgi:hypothetical protein